MDTNSSCEHAGFQPRRTRATNRALYRLRAVGLYLAAIAVHRTAVLTWIVFGALLASWACMGGATKASPSPNPSADYLRLVAPTNVALDRLTSTVVTEPPDPVKIRGAAKDLLNAELKLDTDLLTFQKEVPSKVQADIEVVRAGLSKQIVDLRQVVASTDDSGLKSALNAFAADAQANRPAILQLRSDLSEAFPLAGFVGITEYPIPTAASNTHNIATGPDGNIWFTEASGNKVGKVTISGGFTEYSIPTADSGPGGISAGPDGNLWFAESSAHKVAKVTTSGAFTEYAVPTGHAGPVDILAGPDGNVWFTEFDNKVGKVTTSGVFTVYSIPTFTTPNGIAVGPDGNLWITEDANKVAKVTASGVFTEYAIPTRDSGPEEIVAGPDGNLWFVEINVNKVAKVTTSGVFTEYLIPTPGGSSNIAAGPDGNIWFTELYDKVARVTPTGVFTEYRVDGGPQDIVLGPDGNIWLIEVQANNVARIVPGRS